MFSYEDAIFTAPLGIHVRTSSARTCQTHLGAAKFAVLIGGPQGICSLKGINIPSHVRQNTEYINATRMTTDDFSASPVL